jgi:hypothetical protein
MEIRTQPNRFFQYWENVFPYIEILMDFHNIGNRR